MRMKIWTAPCSFLLLMGLSWSGLSQAPDLASLVNPLVGSKLSGLNDYG
jgi:hypothetical protein